MAKRSRKRRERSPAPTASYVDDDGNVLVLRCELTPGTVRKLREASGREGSSAEDLWRRRTELVFERLAVSWEIAGLPLTDQKMLLGRYRMADAAVQEWVRRTVTTHLERHIPELAEPS